MTNSLPEATLEEVWEFAWCVYGCNRTLVVPTQITAYYKACNIFGTYRHLYSGVCKSGPTAYFSPRAPRHLDYSDTQTHYIGDFSFLHIEAPPPSPDDVWHCYELVDGKVKQTRSVRYADLPKTQV